MNGEVVKFNYPKFAVYHYRYRGAVENHNALSNYGGTKYQIVLESARGKTWWPIRVFDFFIACAEVN